MTYKDTNSESIYKNIKIKKCKNCGATLTPFIRCPCKRVK